MKIYIALMGPELAWNNKGKANKQGNKFVFIGIEQSWSQLFTKFDFPVIEANIFTKTYLGLPLPLLVRIVLTL